MSIEVGSGHFAVIPTFRGFRKAVMAEAANSGQAGSKALSKGFASAGGDAGRGFAKAFKNTSSITTAVKNMRREMAEASNAIGKARIAEADAAGRVRVAETALNEVRAKYGATSSQTVRAEERLASVKRVHEVRTSELSAALERLKSIQSQAANAAADSSRGFTAAASAMTSVKQDFTAVGREIGSLVKTMPGFKKISHSVASFGSAASKAVTVAKGAFTGVGPVLVSPLIERFKHLGTATNNWTQTAVARIPGVSKAMGALSPLASRVGQSFNSLGSLGAAVAPKLLSSMAPVGSKIAAGLKSGFDTAVAAAGRAASSMASTFTNVVGGAGAAIGATLGAAIAGGFGRLTAVEDAKAKMRGFGLEAKVVDDVMQQVRDSVAGTVYTTGEMGNAASAALLAGIKPGKQLEGYMSLLKNTATAAGAPLNEIQSIFGKIAASAGGPVTTELQQLTDRGIPAFSILAERMGLSVVEIKEMASAGKITSDMLVEHLGGAMSSMAEEVGGTTTSSLLRMRSAFNIFGENLLKEAFPGVKAIADLIREVMGVANAALPAIKELFGFEKLEAGVEKINSLTDKIRAFKEQLLAGDDFSKTWLADFQNKVREMMPLLGLAGAALMPMIGTFLSNLPVIGQMLGGLGGNLLAGFAPLLAVGGIAAMLSMDPASFSGMVDSIVSTVQSGLEKIPEIISTIGTQFIPGLVQNLVSNLPTLVTGVMQLVTTIVETIVSMLPSLTEAGVAIITGLITAIVDSLPALLDGGAQLVTALVEGLTIALPKVVEAITAAIPQLVSAITTAIPQIIEGAITLFSAIIDGLLVALPAVLEAVINAIPVLITGILSMLPQLIQGALTLFLGIINGLLQALPLILSAIIAAIPQIISAIVAALPQIIQAGVQIFLGLVTAVFRALPQIIAAIARMIPQLVGALVNAIPQFVQVGVDLIAGLARGIANAAGQVLDTIGSLIGDAIGWAKDLLGIKSPSRVFMSIGNDTGAGFVVGLKKTRNRVKSATQQLVDTATSTMDQLAGYESPVMNIRASVGQIGNYKSSNSALTGIAGNKSVLVQQTNNVQMLEKDPRLIFRQINRELATAL